VAATLTQSTVNANTATGTTAAGGGIFNVSGTVTLTATTVKGNIPNNCSPPGSVSGCTD
jgi:hypothetical protein